MRAIVLDTAGATPTWLERHDLALPEPAAAEVVVEVEAAALNRADLDEIAGTATRREAVRGAAIGGFRGLLG
ncbi:hypothetical protein [Saccharopolyspora sp. NPDC050642]|uniref:hypothetical protein n=1 Tax=Saccharopolyspora sp. NPDC050642 TaxID=3157099 RepID=UPI0033F4E115